ncbi:937683d4-87a0-49f7-8a38-cbb9108e95a1 [Sclerotinia trifoliorum]|uniref:937683d4-87a0-49f7-8a38-cbb9108e95a1 n=1 Tax=Sclerotinia trifoliorum TaxID=28548 RepID=A0A8H2VZY1_9HELO|nr:937683d4-87a0-49f7-8a38-cbb9108e95a1 [Sclerotinia trifoliorum]
MDVFYSYTYGTAGWLALQAVPLMLSPTIIIALLSPEVRDATLLEEYFSRSLGITLLTLSVLIVVLTGSVPLTSSLSDTASSAVTSSASDPKAPYAVPVLTISTIYHGVIAFYCYARYTTSGTFTFALGSLGSTTLFAIGGWCILFGTESGRISKKTGADKRTSGWPFGNQESASARKKALRRGL